jgi:hypothetical protein
MSTDLLTRDRSVTSILAGQQIISLPLVSEAETPLALQMDIPRFQFQSSFRIIGFLPADSSGVARAFLEIDSGVKAILSLTGHVVNGSDIFQVEQLRMKMETTVNRARADFVACSFTALLGLGGQVRIEIPKAAFSLAANFEADLLEISKMLERRLVAFRIMTIERATNVEFELPKELTADEVENVARCYHAIADRSFAWPIPSITVFVPATLEMQEQFKRLNSLDSITLGPDPQFVTLFSQQISLGEGTVTIDDAAIDDWTRIEREFAENDEHIITVVIRSKTHRGRYAFLNPPRLPAERWDPLIQRFLEMEVRFDHGLVEGYNKLALSTLEGLDENQKREVTIPPTLDANAFQ